MRLINFENFFLKKKNPTKNSQGKEFKGKFLKGRREKEGGRLGGAEETLSPDSCTLSRKHDYEEGRARHTSRKTSRQPLRDNTGFLTEKNGLVRSIRPFRRGGRSQAELSLPRQNCKGAY